MSEPRNPVFVLGLPRSRTAWLSVALSSLGLDVGHETMRDLGSFEAWAADLRERLQLGPAGDADPQLCTWLDPILQEWPCARFVVVCRDESEALASLITAAPADQAKALRANWGGFVSIFRAACDRLRIEGRDVRFFGFAALGEESTLLDLAQFATGQRPPVTWARKFQRLRVSSKIENLECAVTAPPLAPIVLPSLDGFDTAGMSADSFREDRFPTVAQWWEEHTGQQLSRYALPPCGVVVSDESGPLAALWALESYAVPVAELVFPVTRPHLPAARAAGALAYAVGACIASAGKNHVPEASFRIFKTLAPRSFVRPLERLGFRETLTDRTALTLTL